jgi:hypothetical protein
MKHTILSILFCFNFSHCVDLTFILFVPIFTGIETTTETMIGIVDVGEKEIGIERGTETGIGIETVTA